MADNAMADATANNPMPANAATDEVQSVDETPEFSDEEMQDGEIPAPESDKESAGFRLAMQIINGKPGEYFFSGDAPSGKSSELVSLAKAWKYRFKFVCQASRVSDEEKPKVAFQMLTGRALNLVINRAEERDENPPSLTTTFSVIDELTEGTAIGPITRNEQLWSSDLLAIGKTIYTETGRIPDISECIAQVQADLSKRAPMANEDSVFFWVHCCREMPSIQEMIRTCLKDNRQIEQTDPMALLSSLRSLNYKFKELVTAEFKSKTKFVPNTSDGGPSRQAGWQPARGQKRSLASATRISRSAPGFDPFSQWDTSELSWQGGDNMSFWIKGQTKAQRAELTAKRLC